MEKELVTWPMWHGVDGKDMGDGVYNSYPIRYASVSFCAIQEGIRRLESHSDGLSPSGSNFQTERWPGDPYRGAGPHPSPTMSGEVIVLEVARSLDTLL